MAQPRPRQDFAQRQLEMYGGQKPVVPVSLKDLEQKARTLLSPSAYDYVAGGAGSESTMRYNSEAFDRWRLTPRLCRNVSQRDLSTEILGMRLPSPVLLAPIGAQGVIHPAGEIASAKAAASVGLPFILSTVSSHSVERVAEVMGNAPRWFQIYPTKDRELNASFLKRAENSGYSAIVATLDTRLLGWRERDLEHAYLPFLQGLGLANYFTDPVFRSQLRSKPEDDPRSAVIQWAAIGTDPGSIWEDLRILRQQTRLPMLLKGVLHPDDARHALDAGIDGIIVSNHGGRQVDGAIAALDALTGVVKVLGDEIPVLFDSGIRNGSHIAKSLALGARAVLLGRPYCWGLALAGENGVHEVLVNLLADLDLTLGLCGCARLSELNLSILRQA